MKNHSKLLAILAFIVALSLPASIFAKTFLPSNIKEHVVSYEYQSSSEQDIENAKVLLTEMGLKKSNFLEKDIKIIISEGNLKPINTKIDAKKLKQNGSVDLDNLIKEIKKDSIKKVNKPKNIENSVQPKLNTPKVEPVVVKEEVKKEVEKPDVVKEKVKKEVEVSNENGNRSDKQIKSNKNNNSRSGKSKGRSSKGKK